MHYIRTVHLTQCGQVWSSEMETPCTYENMNGRAFVARLSPGQENGGNSFYLLLHGGEVCIFLRLSPPSKAGAQSPVTLMGREADTCRCESAPQLWMRCEGKNKKIWEWRMGTSRAEERPGRCQNRQYAYKSICQATPWLRGPKRRQIFHWV